MYLLYAYVAIRVRTVRHIWAVLGGLAVVAAVELVVVLLQWRTGGVLGLEFLGIPESLIPRTTDTGEIGRPSGTLLHPAFMAAASGLIAMPALALAIELRLGWSDRCVRGGRGRSGLHVDLPGPGVVRRGRGGRRGGRRSSAWSAAASPGAPRRVRRGGRAGRTGPLGPDRAKLADNFATGHYLTEVESRLRAERGGPADDRRPAAARRRAQQLRDRCWPATRPTR